MHAPRHMSYFDSMPESPAPQDDAEEGRSWGSVRGAQVDTALSPAPEWGVEPPVAADEDDADSLNMLYGGRMLAADTGVKDYGVFLGILLECEA